MLINIHSNFTVYSNSFIQKYCAPNFMVEAPSPDPAVVEISSLDRCCWLSCNSVFVRLFCFDAASRIINMTHDDMWFLSVIDPLQMSLPCATLTPEADENLWKTHRRPPARRSRKRSATRQSATRGARRPRRPCLHPAAPSSSSHRTGCAVSKVSLSVWFNKWRWESRCNHFMLPPFLPLVGSFTNVYLTIKRPLSNTATLNRIQNDLEHRPVMRCF